MSLINQINHLSEVNHSAVVEMRRHLHKNPELSFKEFKTSEYIQQKLDEFGIEYESGIVKTGVVALIKGKNPETKCLALRADIDALPIKETNQTSYCSINDGVMHACGHDVHTASLLGVAKVLNHTKDLWNGTVKLIFQPGEEILPGGASLMIEQGVLENPQVDVILGQHVSPEILSGKVGFKAGMFMASADELYFKVIGVGGHAAIPNDSINPLKIASKIISSLYDHFEDQENIILSLGAINGGTLGNIVPEQVKMKGTFRAMDEKKRKDSHEKIRSICNEIANEFGGGCEVDIRLGYPFLKNDVSLTEWSVKNAKTVLNESDILEIPKRMTAEDFAYYSHLVPSCFYRLGVGFENQEPKKLHNSNFDIDESALLTSVKLMSTLAINWLLQK
ncbi:MAG: M20 metallopeptidase family protein [Flavobacteriales bacterium]